MTMDVALGLAPVSPRGGERGGKAAKEEAGGFDAALTGKPAKTATHGHDAGDDPRPWKLAAYGDRLALRMPAGSDPDTVPDEATGIAIPVADEPETELPAAEEEAVAVIPALPQRQDDARAPRTEEAGREKTDDEAALRTLLHAASGGGERQAADDGDRSPAQQQRPDRQVAARESHPAPQASASTAAPGEAGREPERTRLAGGTGATGSGAAPLPEAGNGPARMPVNVLGFSTSSAPVMPPAAVATNLAVPLSTTTAGVVAAIESEPAWRAAAAEAAIAQRTQSQIQTHGTVSSLRIQLNPAELGMVTARLVASGSQLEIEIRVESNDARQRLANDADAIVRALRGVGYDVERVTIQQAPQGGNAAQQQGAPGRDPFAQQDQQPRDGAQANAGGRNGREEADNGGTARRHAGETAAQHAGGGVYI